MRIVKQLTERQTRRVKLMTTVLLGGIFFYSMVPQVAEAAIDRNDYHGPYQFNGVVYKNYKLTENAQGYVQEYSNRDQFCESQFLIPGTTLINDTALGVIALLVLMYLFLGIAIVADIFMEAIEVITSKTVEVQVPNEDGDLVTVEKSFWNPTIANLTLMALGSSAPEILLSLMETIVGIEETPSELGPQAIVGSAAFNLLVISAVSIMAVTEVRYIDAYNVFITTAVASTFAYIWFFLVLAVISPDEIEMWEAFLTFGFMIILVIIAYAFDLAHSKSVNTQEERQKANRDASKLALRQIQQNVGNLSVIQAAQGADPVGMSPKEIDNVRAYFKTCLQVESLQDISIEDLLSVMDPENPIERIMYRKEVAKQTSSKRDFVRVDRGLPDGQAKLKKEETSKNNKDIGFESIKYSVTESNRYVMVTIEKKLEEDFSFWVQTRDGEAKAPEDYKPLNEMITMKAREKSRNIQIQIVDDDNYEPDKDFYVVLLDEESLEQLPGDDTMCTVTILDEDMPGIISFKERNMRVRRKDQIMYVYLERREGSDGEISCIAQTTCDPSNPLLNGMNQAIEDRDFVPIRDQKIIFKHNVMEARLEIEMPDCDDREAKHEDGADIVTFGIQISNPTNGAKLSKKSLCIVDIYPDEDLEEERARNEHRNMVEHFIAGQEISCGQQFLEACKLGPTIDEDNFIDDVTCSEAVMHFLTMPWKVIFALIPPRKWAGGWAAFIVALALIGIVVVVVADFANLLGCAINLKTSVTAITIVAMGTSLPDTFASMSAARNSKYADAAVGNVTGSNAVNVFLGLGLPWIYATCYWKFKKEQPYNVPQGDMAFSVVVFLTCSMLCFLVLVCRRVCNGGELGGKTLSRPCNAIILFLLWVTYVVLCSLKAYGVITIDMGAIINDIIDSLVLQGAD